VLPAPWAYGGNGGGWTFASMKNTAALAQDPTPVVDLIGGRHVELRRQPREGPGRIGRQY
jgi:hypothetical protein